MRVAIITANTDIYRGNEENAGGEAIKEIVEEMGTSCTGVLKDGSTEYTVSYNPAYRTGIDKKGLERLKAQHPNVYDDYVSTTESRRFSVKVKKAA